MVSPTRQALNLESAAFILSLQVRLQFPGHDPSWTERQSFLQLRFLACYLSSWPLCREWLNYPFHIQWHDGRDVPVTCACFAVRWLYPAREAPIDAGFAVQRESGWLPKSGGGRGALVKEGRLLVRSVSTCGVPFVSTTVILRDMIHGPVISWPGIKVDSERIEFTAERSVCLLQMTLDTLFEEVWYKNWNRLLDAIDDCVTIQVNRSRQPHLFECPSLADRSQGC